MTEPVFRRITVPLDGTPESKHAVRVAAGIARRADCPIELVHVAFSAGYSTELYGAAIPSAEDIESLRQAAERAVQATAEEVEKQGVRVIPTVLLGDVPSALADHLRGSDTNLIVMTTHDRGRLERLFLGSVSHSVVSQVHLPVLLVRASETDPVPQAASSITHILIPIDESSFSEQVIPHAAALARLLECRITLVTVLHPMFAAAALAGIGGGPSVAMPAALGSRPWDDAARAEIESRALDRVAEPLRASGLTVGTHMIMDGNATRTILEAAQHLGADLIAMSTHGRGALKRLVAGSVSEGVLRQSHLPLLMFRPEHADAS